MGEVVAMPVRSSISPGAFEPETIATMSEAFEAACQLHATGQHEVVREVIARRIVIAARLGERDPVRLRSAALVLSAGLPEAYPRSARNSVQPINCEVFVPSQPC